MRAPSPWTILVRPDVWGNAMTKLIAIAVVCCFATLVGVDQTAFAQAGSTGGTLGKTDKSASGGEEPNVRTERRKRAPRGVGKTQCDRAAGSWRWKWGNNTMVVLLNPDGSSSGTNGNTGHWTCAGRTLTIHWSDVTDTMIFSADGKALEGSGGFGVSVTGTRM